MELSVSAGNVLEHLPSSLSIIGSIVFLGIGVWLKFRHSSVEVRKTDSEVHLAQVESLLNQVKMLSEELNLTRMQMADLHRQNLELMGQLREANKRIAELEVFLTNPAKEKGDGLVVQDSRQYVG